MSIGDTARTATNTPPLSNTGVDPSVQTGESVLPITAKPTMEPHTIPSVDKIQEKEALGGKTSRYANLLPVERPPSLSLDRLFNLPNKDLFFLLFYTLLALNTRLNRIGSNPRVVWDEAHFGKFGSYYIRRTFYFDVHPPLGKMLVGLAGVISGYDGSFEFESGDQYPENLPYVSMRVIMAMYGVMMVPIAYLTAHAFNWNWRARHLFVLMVLFDNGWLTISRFILLDSMLLVFTVSVVLGLVYFHRQQDRPFTRTWWFWLFYTGASIGCVTSVKLVGLFATALVGLYTIEDLWNKFGDTKMPVRTYLRHWCARIIGLIVVPAMIYIASFWVHFKVLNRSGPGDAQMSSLFQANLIGNDMSEAPLEAAYGSKLTFKNMGYGGGLLHSHIQTYPEGSQQQQVTCYHYKDENNEFIISPPWNEPQLPGPNETATGPPRMLRSGDVFRFHHNETGKSLHSHKIKAPVTADHYEVSGYGGHGVIGDEKDNWIVEVVDDLDLGKGAIGSPVKTLTTRMRFRHQVLGCYMRAANEMLPTWGWRQIEVTCDPENNPNDVFTYWNIENHWNDALPSGKGHKYKSHFLRDLVQLNVGMMVSNNALVPDEDKEDILSSEAVEWPFLWNGLRMNGWGADQDKYYLIGNPVIWWGSSLSLGAAVLLFVWYCMRRQRRIQDLGPRDWDEFLFVLKVGGIGWFLHYLPFLIMGRVTYIHHYLPTLYFAVIVFVHLLDHFLWNDSTARYRGNVVTQLRRQISNPKQSSLLQGGAIAPGHGRSLSVQNKNITFAACVALVVGVFLWFRGVSFGMYGNIHDWYGLKWRNSWNIY